jgi:hypothetical protein
MSNGFPNLDPKMHAKLFEITDEIRRLRLEPTSLSKADYAKIMRQLCAALRMSFEYGLENAIRYVGDKTKDVETVRNANAIVQDAKTFLAFLQFETQLLKKCGASESAVDDMIQCIKLFRESTNVDFSNLDVGKIIGNAKELCEKACEIAGSVENHIEGERYIYEEKKRALRTYGTAFVAANLSSLALTFGASAIFTTVSAGFGSLMLGWEGRLRDPTQDRPRQR